MINKVIPWKRNCGSVISFKQQTANSKQQTANSKQQTANSKQQTANSKQQTANSKTAGLLRTKKHDFTTHTKMAGAYPDRDNIFYQRSMRAFVYIVAAELCLRI
jgi:hypothetical protein